MRVARVQSLPMPQVSNYLYPFNTSLEEEIKRLFANFTVDTQAENVQNVEDVMKEFRNNGQDFEYCPDLENDLMQKSVRRRKKSTKPQPTGCVFCRNNGEDEAYCRKHLLKDADGRISCPVLRAYTCPICGACGDIAHTIKYCPKAPQNHSLPTVNTFKLLRNSVGRRRPLK